MTDLLLDIETYLSSNGISEVIGRDRIPDTPESAIALYEYGGSSGQPQVAGVSRAVQVISRNKSATQARLTANQLYALFDTDDGILNLTPERWATVALLQPPFKLKVDSKGLIYYCFNILFTTYHD